MMNLIQQTVAVLVLMMSFIYIGDASSVQCQPKCFAELRKSFEVPCHVLGSNYDLYWYKGLTTSTAPLLSLVDGISGGSEYQKGEFELTINGSLRIINSQLQHESSYTLTAYFENFIQDTSNTELLIYSRPDPPCPLIDACGSTCTGCQLNVTTSGSFTCYVNGSRPVMDLDWMVTNQSGVSFTKEEQTQREMGDRWYTEKTIEYTTPDCGADAIFRCIASLSDFPFLSLLDAYSSTVRIKTEVCKDPPSMEPKSIPKGRAWPLVVIGIIIFFAVIFVLIACCLYRRNGTSVQIETPVPYMQEMHKPKPKPKSKKKSLEERKNILVEGLMQHYEKLCFIKPLPWGEPIPIDALYTTCQCTVTNANGDVSHQDSDFLSTPEFHFDCNNRVFIIANLGFGKTIYTQHLVSDWVLKIKPTKIGKKNKISEPILIYIHLKEVDPSMILSELVQEMMPVGIDLKVDDIVEIFRNFEFQVLLDGLDELSMSTINTNTSPEIPTNDKEERVNLLQEEGENDANLTVGNLLDNKINTVKFKKIKVWVTSREVDDMQASFALPYSKVKLNGFSNSQVNEYIHKTCKYYFKSQAIPQLTLIPESKKDNTVPRNDGQNPDAYDTLEIISKKVTECMELNEISQNFSETPLLLIMIVHIITCRMLDPTGKYKEVNVNKLTTIIRLVITCLESRYVQKVNNQTIQEDIKNLETRLGKIAFENKMSLSLGKRDYWNNKLGEKDTQLALAVGLLKYSTKVGSGGSQLEELAFSSFAGIMFYHEFFQEFLAAQYVPESDKEWAWIDEFIKKSTDDATVRLLQFMFGMNHARLDKAVKSLLKEQKIWNNLIDCIYEISNLEKKQEIIKGMYDEAGSRLDGNMNINIQHLDRKHHRVAFTDFCDACNASDVKLKRMTLKEECAIDFIKDVTLPSLKFLIFLEMNVNEDQFVSIITNLTYRKCPGILQFVECSVPMELREEAKQTVESALKGLDMRIYNCKKIAPATMSVPKYNPKKGKWEKELFPKDL